MSPDIVVTPPEARQTEARQITVAVTGAVATPGTVTVPGNARLQQVTDAAGGLTSDADVTSLNMAARVGDGEHIVIPELSASKELQTVEEPPATSVFSLPKPTRLLQSRGCFST